MATELGWAYVLEIDIRSLRRLPLFWRVEQPWEDKDAKRNDDKREKTKDKEDLETLRQRRPPEERKAAGITEQRNGRKKGKLYGEPLNTVPCLQSPPEE